MEDYLDWVHDTRGGRALAGDYERVASEPQRSAIATMLGLERLESLSARYRIEPQAKGRYLVSGRWQAHLVQNCVATLEPLERQLDEVFHGVFAPAEHASSTPELFIDALGEDEPEPMEDGVIHVGRLVYEQLASTIDPYPRQSGVDFAWRDQTADDASDHPFAALARLRGGEPKG